MDWKLPLFIYFNRIFASEELLLKKRIILNALLSLFSLDLALVPRFIIPILNTNYFSRKDLSLFVICVK